MDQGTLRSTSWFGMSRRWRVPDGCSILSVVSGLVDGEVAEVVAQDRNIAAAWVALYNHSLLIG